MRRVGWSLLGSLAVDMCQQLAHRRQSVMSTFRLYRLRVIRSLITNGVFISQAARFPEGTLGRSGAHDVCQLGELSSRHSSNLLRYPWSLASQVFDHPYR